MKAVLIVNYYKMPGNNMIRKNILNKITWINNNYNAACDEGVYFFKQNDEIVYIGQSGSIKQTLRKRLKQYFSPSDKGTKAFKLKVFTEKYPTCFKLNQNNDVNWEIFKNKYDDWRKFMKTVNIGYIGCSKDTHDILLEEAYLIGLFAPKYNY